MKSMMGIINLHENDNMLREMAKIRPLAAFPFAGRYRLIDFVISNMINSGITNVSILTRGNYRSLMDHLRSGKDWDLARKKDGLFILPSLNINTEPSNDWAGFITDLPDFYNNLDYLRSSRQKYVILTGSSMVCNLDYTQILGFHQEKAADITVLYKEYDQEQDQDFTNATMLEISLNGRVIDMEIAPVKPRSNKLSMEMYFLERELLLNLIDASVARGGTSFLRDIFLRNLENLKIYGMPFGGYLARIHSYRSYFKHSMDLLKPEVYQELFFQNGSIYTKVKDEPPTKYLRDSFVRSSLIANGSVIAGTVENSVLFRGVKIRPGAKVLNSIIMQKSVIDSDVILENVICDKDVHITAGKKLRGEENHPIVIEKGSVI